ncbi:TonB-dependent receptor [Caenimonas aquaedulcis]|uniref:TonB-dependent receptor n=1 Tax=Caenimonas aquaedulcis TaxID=2793270 RepID=A0A931H561_9BURK|nr:TonB-dependent receptor [Caenimonas aquaedulcis]MBG9388799.1 TonB-dependent receptor [Caenimonas aquaedulcis]
MFASRIAAGIAAALPFAAAAHDPVPAPERSLGTVTVTGGQATSLPTEIPTTVEGISRAQIEQTINATDSEDAIKYLPSLLVRKRYTGDYNHAVLSTRASGTGNSARSMVYADGILLSNYLGNGAAFAPRWMLVAPEAIERVDVLYGPFSAAYPGNSAGAVVDFVTRMPRAFEAHARVGYTHQAFSLYATDGPFDGRQASASFGNRSGDWSWRLAASRGDAQGQPLTFATRLPAQGVAGSAGVPVTGAVPGSNRAGQDWSILGTGTQYRSVQDQLTARLAYEFSPTLRATYTAGWWRNVSEGRPETYLRDAAGHPVYAGAVNIAGRAYTLVPADFAASNEDLGHLMQGLSIKSHTHGVWDWEAAFSRYDYARDRLRAPAAAYPAAASGGAGRIVDMHGTGWTTMALKGTWRPDGRQGAHVVDMGLQRDAYALRTIENATADWLGGAPGARNQAFAGNTRLTSAYVQDTWRLAPGWKTVLGLRAERWNAFGGSTSNALVSVAQADRAETHVSPKLALAWQADERWVLKASAGRAVRMPTVSELYQGGVNAAGVLVNNDPDLRPERSWTGELTAERDLGDGLLRLTAFFERTKDALYSQTNVAISPNVTNIQNVEEIRTRGIELSHQAADVAIRGLDLSSSLTWTDSIIAKNTHFPASMGHWQPRIPRWRASAVATWKSSPQWSWTLAARYSGRQYSTLDNSDPNGFAYQGASRYFTVDARVRWQATKTVSAAFGIDNLNNYNYWNFHPYPQRTYSAELRYDL